MGCLLSLPWPSGVQRPNPVERPPCCARHTRPEQLGAHLGRSDGGIGGCCNWECGCFRSILTWLAFRLQCLLLLISLTVESYFVEDGFTLDVVFSEG